jgi:hypothetical protein
MVFIDETGNDTLSDKRYPIFGLGGCAVLASDYEMLINIPWNNLKKNYFRGQTSHCMHQNSTLQPRNNCKL